MSGEIIKVQRALTSTDPCGHSVVLVYAKGHKHMCPQPLTNELAAKLRGDHKAYFRGYYSSIVGWAINERVEDQDW